VPSKVGSELLRQISRKLALAASSIEPFCNAAATASAVQPCVLARRPDERARQKRPTTPTEAKHASNQRL
jgi:hypothetical protein